MSEMKFITFEGVDGSGKSTIIKMVSEYFEKNNIPYISTREPGGSRIAEQIRNIILSCENSDLHPNTEALLYGILSFAVIMACVIVRIIIFRKLAKDTEQVTQ